MVADDRPDYGLETLLNLHGWTDEVGGGFWVSVKAFRVPPDDCRPQGINYSLSMHRPGGKRILGYDNAHPPKIGKGPARKSLRRSRGCDHRHFRGRITWYDFAFEIFRLARLPVRVAPISSEEFSRPAGPARAKRPRYSILTNTKLFRRRPWEEALQEYLETGSGN